MMIQWHSFTQSLNRKIYATASRSFDAISYDIINRLKVTKISSRKIAVWKDNFVLFNALFLLTCSPRSWTLQDRSLLTRVPLLIPKFIRLGQTFRRYCNANSLAKIRWCCHCFIVVRFKTISSFIVQAQAPAQAESGDF